MASKLFVGGLDYGTTDEGLHDAFAEFGSIVSAKVILDRETGRSRGFGFVEFSSRDDAKSAIEALDGSQLDGRRINVDEAREKGGGRSGRGGGGGGGGGRGRDRW